jgi:hypothetical protein
MRLRDTALATLAPIIIVACSTGPSSTPEESTRSTVEALTSAQCEYFQVGGKVKICHATGSAKTPFTLLSVSDQSCVDAHTTHALDYVSLDGKCAGGTCLPERAPCDATLPCCEGTSCQNGECQVVDRCRGVVCNPSDQCHVAYCDGASGQCVNEVKVEEFPCDDGSACTRNDRCRAGACVGLDAVECLSSDQCHAAGLCDPNTGACSNPVVADGTGCNDGNGCTQIDTCLAGTCVGSNAVECRPADECHVAGTCDPQTGVCSNPPSADFTPCDDRNLCTQSDICIGGACVGTAPVHCAPQGQCEIEGSCEPSTGACRPVFAPDGTACNDTNACTSSDVCNAGKCVAGTPVSCPPIDECHFGGSCDSRTGACADGARRPDGTACTQGACLQGSCLRFSDGVVAYWPLDTDGADLSGNHLDLSIVGAPSFTSSGRVGGAVAFNKNPAQYLVRPQSDPQFDFGASDFSMQLWVSFNQVDTEQTLVEKFTGGGGPGWTLTKLTGFGEQFYAAPAVVVNAGWPLTTPAWHHLVVTKSGPAYRIYVDNQLAASGSSSTPLVASANPLLVGKRNQGDNRGFPVDGKIDEIAIWNRALTQNEVFLLWNNFQGRQLIVH